MPPATPTQFAVVASQRTGSTLLIRSLDTSPRIFCAGELFHAGPGIYHAEWQFPYRLLGSRRLSRLVSAFLMPARVTRHLHDFYRFASPDSEAVGFKLMISHARSYPSIMPYLRSRGVTFVYLLREDVFATALSYYRASLSGVFHEDRSRQDKTEHEVSADLNEFSAFLQTCRSDRESLLGLQKVFGGHVTTYERMTESWDEFGSQLGDWIGVRDLRLQRATEKLGSTGRTIRIVNEEMLRMHFGAK
jgi:hypothetical protein